MPVSLFSVLAIAQGVFYLLTGVWPLVSIDTFQRVTGPKRDLWLVRTVGVLITVIGAVLLTAGVRGVWSLEIFMLGAGAALAMTLVDSFYVMQKVIPPIYLLDAAVEIVVIIAWIAAALVRSV